MPRGTAAGKKIGWRDAVQTVWTLIRWRLAPFAVPAPASFVFGAPLARQKARAGQAGEAVPDAPAGPGELGRLAVFGR